MILSDELLFSDEQAITTTAASTNLIDFGDAAALLGGPADQSQDIGRGVPVPIFINVTEAFAAGTSLQVQLQTDSDSGFGSPTTLLETEVVATASLVAGYQFSPLYLPQHIERYVRLNYVVVGTHSAGKVSAGITGASSQVL